MSRYRAYGLGIRSDLALPELMRLDADREIDVDVRFGAVTGPMPPAGSPRVTCIEPHHGYFAWPHIGRFSVTNEGQVTIDSLTSDTRALRYALLGPVFAGYLQIRQVPLLHGSAVAHGGRAILCIGRKGAGKSSMAAALVSCGCVILNDDVVPFRLDAESLRLVPGFPALKLSPQIHRLFLPDAALIDGPASAPDDKIMVSPPHCPVADVEVGTVVILDPDRPVAIEPVAPLEALGELLQHGYSLKFGEDALRDGQAALLFEACARLAQAARVVRVGRTDDVGDLPAVARQLL